MEHQRKNVGFKPLDSIIPDGVHAGDQILVSGTPGTGKTLLAMQFISEAARAGETGIYATFESSTGYLTEQAERLGLGVRELAANGKLEIIRLDPSDLYAAFDDLKEHVKKLGAKRLVIDSVSIMTVYASSYRNLPEDMIEFLKKTTHQPPIAMGDGIKKQMIYYMLEEIRKLGCTTILISELPKNSEWYSRDTVSEFICDGIILLDQQILGEENVLRTVTVVKLRGGDYKGGVHEFIIKKGKGIVVKNSS
ncbi:MAG: ATPase domain-containing protein [Candidatus Micrarchaeota archaeon]